MVPAGRDLGQRREAGPRRRSPGPSTYGASRQPLRLPIFTDASTGTPRVGVDPVPARLVQGALEAIVAPRAAPLSGGAWQDAGPVLARLDPSTILRTIAEARLFPSRGHEVRRATAEPSVETLGSSPGKPAD